MQNFQEIVLTYLENDAPASLKYVLFFSNVHDDKSCVRGGIDSVSYSNAEELVRVILQNQPNFVKDKWYALEASIDSCVVLHILRKELE